MFYRIMIATRFHKKKFVILIFNNEHSGTESYILKESKEFDFVLRDFEI